MEMMVRGKAFGKSRKINAFRLSTGRKRNLEIARPTRDFRLDGGARRLKLAEGFEEIFVLRNERPADL
jgi:hypothetical protein